MQSADHGARGNDLLTSGEVARMADVAVETVRDWANSGKLVVAHVASGMRLFRREDVEAFLARRAGGAA